VKTKKLKSFQNQTFVKGAVDWKIIIALLKGK
jgi:hypothetical protein